MWLFLPCTSVGKDLRNFTFYEDDFKKRLEMTHFKPQKIPSIIYEPLMADLNIRIFIRIHRDAYFMGKLQEAISTQFQKAMEELELDKNEKPLSMAKLISAGLLAFTVPPNTTFVVDEKNAYGHRVTGFVNSDKRLVGWGLAVN